MTQAPRLKVVGQTHSQSHQNNVHKIQYNQKFCSNQNSQKYLILDNYETNFDRYPKRVIQQSHKNFREKIINIPNISYVKYKKKALFALF